MSFRDFDDSTPWSVSDFERVKQQTGSSGFARLEGPTVLSTTLQAELQRIEFRAAGSDVLDVVAACMRHREAALLCLQYNQWVWPVTLFPSQMLYHSPQDFTSGSITGMATLKLLAIEAPEVKPMGHWMAERVANPDQYRPLAPLLTAMALNGPRSKLLSEISGPLFYRAVNGPSGDRPSAPGAMGAAVERLRRESVNLRDLSNWPGMSGERAARLLNALYLSSTLMVSRTGHATPRSSAAAAPSAAKGSGSMLAALRKRIGL